MRGKCHPIKAKLIHVGVVGVAGGIGDARQITQRINHRRTICGGGALPATARLAHIRSTPFAAHFQHDAVGVGDGDLASLGRFVDVTTNHELIVLTGASIIADARLVIADLVYLAPELILAT